MDMATQMLPRPYSPELSPTPRIDSRAQGSGGRTTHKTAKGTISTAAPGMSASLRVGAMAKPRAKGSMIPLTAITELFFMFASIVFGSSSMPTGGAEQGRLLLGGGRRATGLEVSQGASAQGD
jgi:hypothetical protein